MKRCLNETPPPSPTSSNVVALVCRTRGQWSACLGRRERPTRWRFRMRYTTLFFKGQMTSSRESADLIAGICRDLLNPQSVVDIGCGVGTWLAAFKSLGVSDIAGYDGDWVDRRLLQIS